MTNDNFPPTPVADQKDQFSPDANVTPSSISTEEGVTEIDIDADIEPERKNASGNYRGFDRNCIAEEFWTPSQWHKDLLNIENGCWKMHYWGMTMQDNRLFIMVDDSPDKTYRGIYTPIPENVEIRFKVRIDEFTTSTNTTGVFLFGIGNLRDEVASNGRHLMYSLENTNDPVRRQIGKELFVDTYQAKTDYTFGETQHVVFVVDGITLKIYINNELFGKPITITPDERDGFWIAYRLSNKQGSLNAFVWDFEVMEISKP